MGAYNAGKRKSRVVKVTFQNEYAAGVLRRKAPRLAEHNLLGHIYMKEDETLAERQRKWTDRRRGDVVETGQGNIHRNNLQTERGEVQPTDEPEHAEFITLDYVGESGEESEIPEGETRTAMGEENEREVRCSQEEVQKMKQATIQAGMVILGIREGSGNWERIGQESVEERIARLQEITRSVTANRSSQSGNWGIRGSESVD